MLLERITQDLKMAMKNKDKEKLETVRLIKSALMNEKIKLMVEQLTEDQEISVIAKEVKQRKDSISEFTKASRMDLVEKERTQLEIIETYLPEPLSIDEIKNLVLQACTELNATSMKDMGKVMNAISHQVKGKADMAQVNLLVKEYLNK